MRISDWSSDVCYSDLVALGGDHRRSDQVDRVIGLRAVEGRGVLELLLVVADELGVGGERQVGRPEQAEVGIQRQILLQLQRHRVDREDGIERDLLLQAGLAVLGEELHAPAARSDERTSGKEWVSTCRCRWWVMH